jgi:betaine lipid synthase
MSLLSYYSQLVKFYRGQAEVYDSTRNVLLRGRDTMLSLSVAHLRHLREASPTKRFVWVDIGGGTGRFMNEPNMTTC